MYIALSSSFCSKANGPSCLAGVQGRGTGGGEEGCFRFHMSSGESGEEVLFAVLAVIYRWGKANEERGAN